jgi:hypothetical protein
VAQTIYAHVSKCKSDKIKAEKKKTIILSIFTITLPLGHH